MNTARWLLPLSISRLVSFQGRRWRLRGTMALVVSLVAIACSSPAQLPVASEEEAANGDRAANELTILWDKGYVLEEDEAIEKVVSDWEAKTGIEVTLSFYNSAEIAPKTLRSRQAGNPPDILLSVKSAYPISDWQGKLADVSAVILPMRDRYSKDALASAKMFGTTVPEGEYYGVPINQSSMHVHYWRDLLATAGYTAADIPTDWDGFWAFWQTVQSRLQATQNADIYGLGLPFSASAADTYQIFEQVLRAYNVRLLDEAGQLQVEDPTVRQGIVDSLNWYVQFYRQKSVPPQAVNWLDSDNNRAFLNREVVMTLNPTLSIPAAVRNDAETYFNQLGTIELPPKPDGTPLPHLVIVRKAIVFNDGPNQEAAKDFLAYLVQPEVLNTFLKSSYGRFSPPIDAIAQDPFWLNEQDPHVSTVNRTLVEGRVEVLENVRNPAYGVFLEENVWGEVLQRMAVENLSAEAGADIAIARLQAIFAEWQ
ncbi:ABC transporter substrate-binding protein [Almyronema epifaneia]|uniref:ABC transporter substrate-binding protein n=1 Tax=Almyronema epifaneia S1 TaxID=2991925 RepID=A0ABW6IB45_9CYAN